MDEDSGDEDYQDSGQYQEGCSLEEFSSRSIKVSMGLLKDMDDKLFGNLAHTSIPAKSKKTGISRGYDFGYDAHNESVDNREIEMWRESFQYLQVTGKNIWNFSGSQSSDVGVQMFSPPSDTCHKMDDDLDSYNLEVIGRSYQIHDAVDDSIHDSVNIEDGILEEVISFHQYPHHGQLSIQPSKTIVEPATECEPLQSSQCHHHDSSESNAKDNKLVSQAMELNRKVEVEFE